MKYHDCHKNKTCSRFFNGWKYQTRIKNAVGRIYRYLLVFERQWEGVRLDKVEWGGKYLYKINPRANFSTTPLLFESMNIDYLIAKKMIKNYLNVQL